MTDSIRQITEKIGDLRDEITSLEDGNRECKKEFTDYLDSTYGDAEVCGYTFSSSRALKELDEVAWDQEYKNWADAEITELEYEVKSLVDDLECNEDEIEGFKVCPVTIEEFRDNSSDGFIYIPNDDPDKTSFLYSKRTEEQIGEYNYFLINLYEGYGVNKSFIGYHLYIEIDSRFYARMRYTKTNTPTAEEVYALANEIDQEMI